MKYFFVIILFSVGFIEEEYDLKLKLEKNHIYYHSDISEIYVTQLIDGQEIKTTKKIGSRTSFEVFDDYYDLLVPYESFYLTMQTPLGLVDCSSEKKDSIDFFSQILREMTNKPFNVKMKKNGTIETIENIDTIYTSMMNAFTGMTLSGKNRIIEQFRRSYGEKAFKGSLEMITAIYPDKKIKLNEKWNNQIELESGMSSKMKNTFKLIEVTGKIAFVKGTSESYAEDKEAYNKVNGMPVKYNLKGNANYDIKLDYVSGWIVDATITQIFRGNAEILDNSNMPGGIKIPTEMKIKMIISDQ